MGLRLPMALLGLGGLVCLQSASGFDREQVLERCGNRGQPISRC